MKNRKLTLISPELGELLVKQVAHELKNRNLYLSYANYFSIEGVLDLEKYYRKRAEEENRHHQWIMDYLSEGDYKFMYPAVEQNTEKVENYVDPFKQTIEREILTTDMIYVIYDQASEEKDYMTKAWLNKLLVLEQIEEEDISRGALVIIEEEGNIFSKAERILDLLSKK